MCDFVTIFLWACFSGNPVDFFAQKHGHWFLGSLVVFVFLTMFQHNGTLFNNFEQNKISHTCFTSIVNNKQDWLPPFWWEK